MVSGRSASFSGVSASSSSSSAANVANVDVAPPSSGSSATPTSTPPKPDNGKNVVIVGAGVGGLCMAGRLRREGYAVTLLERGTRAGGRMTSAETPKGYRFDTGPSLLLFPDKYREAFEALGRDIKDYVDIVRVCPPYRIHYGEDHTSVDLSYDCEEMRATCESIEPGSSRSYFRWLSAAKASLDLGVKAFIERDCTSALDFINLKLVGPLALAVNPLELLLPQQFQMSQYFKSDKLKALFSYQELYVGLSPYNAPGVFSLLAATEITDGVWYPKGGFQTVRNALLKICEEDGVDVRFESEVAEITTVRDDAAPDSVATNGERATGVRLADGTTLDANLVVCNADIPVVYDKYLRSDASVESQPNPYATEAARQNDMDYSCSVINFCWSLKGTKLDGLRHHNVFLSGDYEGSWNRSGVPEDFREGVQHNFYVHRPKATDPSCVPSNSADADEESLMVLLPVGNLAQMEKRAKEKGVAMPTMEEMVAAGRESVLRRFEESGHGNLRDCIVEETVIDPREWEEAYNLKHGAVFGLSHGLLQLACFRPPTKTQLPAAVWPETPVPDGLHFIGASTRPGNGVPLVMMGVAVEFENILKAEKARTMAR